MNEYVALASEQEHLFQQYKASIQGIRARMKILRPMVKSFLSTNQVTSVPFVPPDAHRSAFGDQGGVLVFQAPKNTQEYAPWTETQIKDGLRELFHLLCEENECHELDEQAKALSVGEAPEEPPLRHTGSMTLPCHPCPSLTRFIKLLQNQEDTWFVALAFQVLSKHRVAKKSVQPKLLCKKRKL